jgi:hypothetical protein
METISIARCEFKYPVPPEMLGDLRRHLLRYCVPDEFSRDGDWYPISSLYLDSPDMRMYRDTEEGAITRFKVRVRGYGDCSGPVKLEVKRKSRELVTKTSATTAPGRAASFRDIPRAGEFARLVDAYSATPKMLVLYERLAFSSVVDDYVRVTFDRRMRCQPARGWNLVGDPRAWRWVDDPASMGTPSSVYLMELKFAVQPPAWLRDLVVGFGLSRKGYSKYGRAVRRWQDAREPAWDFRPSGFLEAA